MGLTLDQILGADDLRSEVVEVPEWGGSVTVRTMTGADADRLFELMSQPDGRKKFRDALIVATVVDDAGVPMFTADHVSALRTKSATALKRVADAAMRLNGMASDSVEVAAGN